MKLCITLLLTVITFASVAVAQSTKDKIEIGVQTTSLTLTNPDFTAFDQTEAGIGGRFTFNFNRFVAAEAEINFFPQKAVILIADGSAIQGQFGVKIGKRFKKFGIFGKVRPGFLSVNKVGFFIPPGSQVGSTDNFILERRTFFTVDAGGVLELYPSRRMVVRLEAGDTLVRHPARFEPISFIDPTLVQTRAARFNHNFQFTAGIGFRLGDFPTEDTNLQTQSGQERTKRFEVGAQFTSLFVNPPDPSIGGARGGFPVHTEPGFGGRFTFNLTDNVAFEAEGNYYTRLLFPFPAGGHMYQGQFGGKVGKRFDRWGLFGKARPGFVGFTRVLVFPSVQLPGVAANDFVGKRIPSLDLGGVVEFYVSPRWMARFDVGDTMIRYDEISVPSVGQLPIFVIQPKSTRHNLQVSSGIGFRF
jgi:hypothetical protein